MSRKTETHFRVINQLSTHLQSLLESERFFQEVVDLIQSHFQFYGIQLWSVSSKNIAILEGHAGVFRGKLQPGQEFPPSQGIINQVIRSRRSYLSNDTQSDPHYTALELDLESRSQVTVPVLNSQGLVKAILSVESDQLEAFHADDVFAFETLASQLAVSLQNRYLLEEARDFNRKLQKAVDEKTAELKAAQEKILESQAVLQKENLALKNWVNQGSQKPVEYVGQSAIVRNLLEMVDRIAPTQTTVLIQGESGTGKELIARRLHQKSDRSQRPLVSVNCGALTESLLESELFGHEKGAFTGAVQQKIGLCELADGGTLFLDEIGEISPSLQTKLLRFLQEGEFFRVGGTQPIRVQVRIISATNRDLEKEVQAQRFREDLFYRLNTITVKTPALRQRKEDIPALVGYFTAHAKKCTEEVLEIFKAYPWPGNIRELQNTLERLQILSNGEQIEASDLPLDLKVATQNSKGSMSLDGLATDYKIELPLEEIEKMHIQRTLAHFRGNKTRAAHSLGITVKTLYNKLARYDIVSPDEMAG